MLRIFLFAFFLYSCNGEVYDLDDFRTLSDLNEKWLRTLPMAYANAHSQLPIFEFLRRDTSSVDSAKRILSQNNATKCWKDLVRISFNPKANWTLQMLDSDGKLSSGLKRGALTWPGHFGECVSTYAPRDKNDTDFSGQYCSVTWNITLNEEVQNLKLTVGMCFPDSCTNEELFDLEDFVLERLESIPGLKKLNNTLTLAEVSCKLNKNPLDSSSKAYVVIIFIFISLVIIASIATLLIQTRKSSTPDAVCCTEELPNHYSKATYQSISGKPVSSETMSSENSFKSYQNSVESATYNEPLTSGSVQFESPVIRAFHSEKRDSVLERVLLCFSVSENGKKILNTDLSEGQLSSIHGIRFLSLTWVILGHAFITAVPIISNRLDVLNELDTIPYQTLLQAHFSVDSFFLIGGVLLAYLFMKEADKKEGRINWIYFYVHRYCRLTPAYMVVVFFYLYVFKYIGSGPFWDDHHGDQTRASWWRYLLYINNFIPIHQMSVGWSWYLANDMQFYIISPLFLYPMWRWPKVGFSIVLSFLLGSWITTGVLSYVNNLVPLFVGITHHVKDITTYTEKMWDSFNLIYDTPYCRIAPYLIGIMLGYILYRNGQQRNFLNWWQLTLGWSSAAYFSLVVIYGLYNVEMSRTTAAFYNSLCRTTFSLGLAWVIFACETGHGGYIHKILTWKFFVPLSRLSYCTYLVHPILIHGYYYAYPVSFFFTKFVAVTNFMGFLIMSYGLGFGFTLVFESPLLNLEKLILKRNQS